MGFLNGPVVNCHHLLNWKAEDNLYDLHQLGSSSSIEIRMCNVTQGARCFYGLALSRLLDLKGTQSVIADDPCGFEVLMPRITANSFGTSFKVLRSRLRRTCQLKTMASLNQVIGRWLLRRNSTPGITDGPLAPAIEWRTCMGLSSQQSIPTEK